MKYYGVKGNNYKKVFTSWDEAKEEISKIEKPKYKSFNSLMEAEAFINDEVIDDNITEPKCYIDGSFDAKTNKYSFGGVLIIDGKCYEYKKAFGPDEYSLYRNVSGEIRGAAFIINYCYKKNIKKIHIFYDYIGIEKWYIGEWKANTNIAIKYVEFKNNMIGKIDVIFHKIKSHTNNKYNDLADKLAKEALDII